MSIAEKETALRLRMESERARKWPVPARIERIMRAVAEQYGIFPSEIRGGGRRSDSTAKARREIARLLRSEGMSLPQIGRYFGGMHHTSVHAMLKPRKQPARSSADDAIPCPDESGIWAI